MFGLSKEKSSGYEQVQAEEEEEAALSRVGLGGGGGGGYPREVRRSAANGTTAPSSSSSFASNYVSTTKYNRWTFLPLATLQQYRRGANVYLLFIAVLCCIPAISPLMPLAAVLPVVFVLGVSLLREGVEDYNRFCSDQSMNGKKCQVFRPGGGEGGGGLFAAVAWRELRVGDLVLVKDRDWVPADLLLLCSSNGGGDDGGSDEGCAFIDTMDLDGETNLKRREAPKATAALGRDRCAALFTNAGEGGDAAVLRCVGPSGDLYSFDGALSLDPQTSVPVSEANLLLRSSRLRNTKWALGLVVYTGAESKVMLNGLGAAPAKQSALEVKVNAAILAIFAVQVAMSLTSALAAAYWAGVHCPRGHGAAYLFPDPSPLLAAAAAASAVPSAAAPASAHHCPSAWAVAALNVWTYVILLNSLIPASLIVTLEVVKVLHAKQIEWDHALVKGFDRREGKWRGAEAHSSSLNEALGQVDFIFSDKTGTLTENKMELLFVTANGRIYSAADGAEHGLTEGGAEGGHGERQQLVRVEAGAAGDAHRAAARADGSKAQTLNRMLAVAHTVMIEEADDDEEEEEEEAEAEEAEEGQKEEGQTKKKSEKKEAVLNADSPDEVALVLGAQRRGVRFAGRSGGDQVHLDIEGGGAVSAARETWRVLSTVPFSSARKRMTVVVQRVTPPPLDPSVVQVWMKGADSAVLARLAPDPSLDPHERAQRSATEAQLRCFAMLGLRTLCFAAKAMRREGHAAWQHEWEASKLLPPLERAVAQEKLAAALEDGEDGEGGEGFALVGTSAVEDKLQENVSATIVRLARAGIKLWVLTGDKEETAVEIGRATNLLTPQMKVHTLTGLTSEAQVLDALGRMLGRSGGKRRGGGGEKDQVKGSRDGGGGGEADAEAGETEEAEADKAAAAAPPEANAGEALSPEALVVDGATLNFVVQSGPSPSTVTTCGPATALFVALATRCHSVVVCRCSPLQKALVVLLVRQEHDPSCRSLAVGDGANDVPMINAANVGVGIAGLEGAQAARAADYAVQQFQDLDRLLLHHGRLAYFRTANLCAFFFYKSWTFTLPQWLFGFACAFSGLSLYEAIYVPSFNMFFSSLPVFLRAVLDTDTALEKAGPLLPELYHVAKADLLFSPRVLSIELGLSGLHATACFLLPYLCLDKGDLDLWTYSLAAYSLVVLTCTLRIFVHTRALSGPLAAAYALSLLGYVAFEHAYDAYAASRSGNLMIAGAAPRLNGSNPKFLLTCLLAAGATVASEVLMRHWADAMAPTNVDLVRAASPLAIANEGDRRAAAATNAAGAASSAVASTGKGGAKEEEEGASLLASEVV